MLIAIHPLYTAEITIHASRHQIHPNTLHLQKRVLNKKQYDIHCSDKEYSMKDEIEQTKIQAHILKKKDHCRTFLGGSGVNF